MTMADPHQHDTQSPYYQPDIDKTCLRERQVGGDHYRTHEIQPWDVVDAYGLSFYEGNVLKYLLRRKVDTARLTDLYKARHYLDKCIDREIEQSEATGG